MNTEKPQPEDVGALAGMFAISGSTLVLEIILTKFLSFKLYHHMTFAILSTVILSLGAAGILTYLRPRFLGLNSDKPWHVAGVASCLYAITIAIVIPYICLVPILPAEPNLFIRTLTLPGIFFLLSLPFLFGGICISQTLTFCRYSVPIVYFWDLLAAAIGAVACPVLLPYIGGFGTIALASGLGLIGAICFWWNTDSSKRKIQAGLSVTALLAIAFCLSYPIWAWQNIKLDIITFKDLGPWVALKDFGGIEFTHWNAIARVDVSRSGTSNYAYFRYGLSTNSDKEKIVGRYVILDGGANTRQFRMDGNIADKHYLGSALWASPYIAKPDAQKALVFGGGGGIDILVAKYSKIPNLTVVEMNPAIYNLLTGRADDPKGEYFHSLVTDPVTTVNTIHDEARHFASTQAANTYDTIQASGVDTLTAIQTGGMSLVENYLYTVEAVRDYVRLLKPEGILSLTHWRTNEPATSLRMFITYLAYLDSMGIKEPWKHIVVVGSKTAGAAWSDSMLKMTPFTEAELANIRDWARKSNFSMVFDPERKMANDQPWTCEPMYYTLGFADPQARERIFAERPEIPRAVHDDSPYFYAFFHRDQSWSGVNTSNMPISLMLSTLLVGAFLLFLPLYKLRKETVITGTVLWCAAYFAISGFAFLLYETTIIQMLTVFVGGPTYALAVVLVAVLFGYSLGSWAASRIVVSQKTFVIFGCVLGLLFLSLYFVVPKITTELLPLNLPSRLAVASSLTLITSFIVAMAVTSAMAVVRNRFGSVVSWMWGISSIANAIGSMSFVAVTQITGISSCLLIVAVAYLVANLLFASRVKVA
jgi:hypothetical protein